MDTNTAATSMRRLVFGGGTPLKAALTALVVGTILVVINHGDTMIVGEHPPFWKIALTYCVPYLVTTWGAVTGKLSELKAQKRQADASI